MEIRRYPKWVMLKRWIYICCRHLRSFSSVLLSPCCVGGLKILFQDRKKAIKYAYCCIQSFIGTTGYINFLSIHRVMFSLKHNIRFKISVQNCIYDFLRFKATAKHMSANDVPRALDENSHWRALNKRINSVSKPTPGDNSENSNPKPPNPEMDDLISQKLSKCLDLMQATCNRHETKANKKHRYELDTFARIIFPVAFVVFNIIYWSVWPIEAWCPYYGFDKLSLSRETFILVT